MSLNWQNLKENRDEILKVEIGSLLFNLGKTHIGIGNWKNYFPNENSNFGSYKDYYQQSYFEDELNQVNQDLKNFIFDTDISINGENKKWVEYFKGDVSSSDIVKKVFFRGCENINSGIDKGSPRDNNQLKGKLWISNAFGSFKEEVTKDSFDGKRRAFFEKLHHFLDGNNYYENSNWAHIREFVIKELKNWYSHLLSDSRFPINDVTLFDQAYMSTTMFKASIAGIFLNTSQSQDYISNPQSIKWQILGIQYDKLSLADKGLKPAHIIWYRENSKELDEAIKNIIENYYAFGNEVYRNETGIYFLVPDGIKIEDIENVKNKILCEFKSSFDDEVYPYISFTKPSRGIMNLTNLLEKSKENFLKADYSLKSPLTLINGAKGICQVCQNRLVKDKKNDDETLMCDICRNRKKGRIEKWLHHQSGETIWIDELADSNNRVALISLKFELMEWLSGGLLSSLLVNNCQFSSYINSLKNDLKNQNGRNKKLKNLIISDLVDKNLKNRVNLENFCINLILERSIGDKWEEFIKDSLSDSEVIDFDKREIIWNKLNDNDFELLSKIILQFLLRKNPSPTRLRRVWESTQEFFNEVKRDILDSFTEIRTKESFKQKVPDFAYLVDEGKINDNQEYKQYFSIIDPTPISWQFIIPTAKVEGFINKVQKLYYQNFKYVNGKLPLHIGVVVQKSKDPLYIGIKALRNIRRDIKNWSEIKKEGKNLLPNLECYEEIVEQNNNAKDFYSLYETNNFDYDFMLLPSNKGVKKYNSNDSFIIYPNTIDFEFLDTNARRNDIYYKNGKRDEPSRLKINRPYSWEEFENFREFKEIFSGKTALLHRLVSLIYSKMKDWKSDEDSFKIFMKNTFKRVQKQENIDFSKLGFELDNDNWEFDFNKAKKFIDMFEFWHTALKEI